MRSISSYLFVLIVFCINTIVLSQIPEKGRPFTQYYAPSDYGAGSNTFNVVRDSLGVFYFSNDEGVLLFDGSEWTLIPIIDNKPVYWVNIDHTGTILVASTGEIGYLDHLQNGQKVYKSLFTSGPKAEFENVWEIATTSKESLFRSKKLLISYQNGNVKTIGTDSTSFDVALTVRDTIYTRVRGKGLAYINNGILQPVAGGDFFANTKLNSYLPYDDKILIGTRSGDLFLIGNGIVESFPTEANKFLRKYKIYDGCLTQSGNYAYSAPLKGVAILDKKGKLLQILDETSGLPAHQYLFVGVADPSSLWMTHAVGISRAEILSPISYFDPSFGLEDVITDIKAHKGFLYVTTLKGFYQYQKDQNQFLKINRDLIQEFHGISIVNDKIFVGGQDGLLSFSDGKLKKLTNRMVHELSASSNQNLIFAGGGEGGFDIISEIDNTYQIDQVNGFTEPIKKIIPFEKKVALVSQFGKLLFVNLEGISQSSEYAIDEEINIGNFDALKIDNELLIITPDNWNLTNTKGERIQTGSLSLSNKIANIQITSELTQNSFWICYKDDKRKDHCEKLTFKDGRLTNTNDKFNTGFRINSIFRSDDGIDWFGGDKGVIRFDSELSANEQSDDINCRISSTMINNDSLLSNYGFNSTDIVLPHDITSLQFKFYSDQSFSSNDQILFQYKLVGLDKDWSSWTHKTSKEYSYLNSKRYKFQVRAKNGFGKISKINSFDFQISSPWYLSGFSLFVYILLILLIIIGYNTWRTKSLKKAKKHLEKLIKNRTEEVEQQKLILEEQKEVLRQTNVTKDQLFSIIGHDLRGPLTSIQGITDLIKHYRQEKQTKKVDELTDHMNDSVKGLNHLLDNLLSWALNRSGNFKLKKEQVRLHFLILEVIGVLKDTALSKNIGIFTEVDEKITLEADSNSLGTILRNLISNAIKFTHKGGQIRIKVYTDDQQLTIEVQDNGVGIPDEKKAEIFELANTTYGTSNEKGTGLGLVLVKDFIELNGGKLKIESEVYKGTTFFLIFPFTSVS